MLCDAGEDVMLLTVIDGARRQRVDRVADGLPIRRLVLLLIEYAGQPNSERRRSKSDGLEVTACVDLRVGFLAVMKINRTLQCEKHQRVGLILPFARRCPRAAVA